MFEKLEERKETFKTAARDRGRLTPELEATIERFFDILKGYLESKQTIFMTAMGGVPSEKTFFQRYIEDEDQLLDLYMNFLDAVKRGEKRTAKEMLDKQADYEAGLLEELREREREMIMGDWPKVEGGKEKIVN